MRPTRRLLAHALALAVPLCTWAQTEVEPNNGTAQATPVIYNTPIAGSTGACAPTDNSVDYFSFTPPAQGVLRIQTAMSNNGAAPLNVSVELRNSVGSVLQTFTATAGANNVLANNSFTRLCSGTGLYYISIPNPSGTVCTNYSFTYDVIAPVYANDVEPNNSTAQAADTLPAGVDQDGHLDFLYDNDFDYYRILAPNDGVLNVTVSAEHPGTSTTDSIDVYLRNSVGSILRTWKVGVGANSIANTQVLTRTCTGTEQVYFLEPYTPTLCGVSYRLNYTVTAPLYADDAEPNNSTAQAIVANANTTYEGRVEFEYDNNFDYYQLQAPNDGVLNVTILAENASASTGTMNVYLRNNAGSQLELWTANVGANGSPATTTFTRNCTGTELIYFLEPSDPTVCGVSYRFSYSVTPPVFADDAEPNNSTAQAIVANANTNYEGRVEFEYDNNFDYYVLQAPNDGVLNVTILAENASASTGTMNVYLRNNVGSQLQLWTANVGANGSPATTTFTRNCTGTELFYFLEPDDPTVCGVSYRLSYSVTPPLYADDAEPNNSTAQAPLIELNDSAVYGRLTFNYDNDFDYFKVNHPGGVLRVITSAENAGPAGVMSVYLRNAVGSQMVLNSNVAVGGNGIPALDTTQTAISMPAGYYYIEPYSPSICGVSYRLNCNDDDNDGVCNTGDLCANTPNGEGVNGNGCSCSQVVIDDNDVCTLDQCTNGNVTNTFQDADGDLTCDANDACPNDPLKIAAGQCGCGVPDTDSDSDGTANCNDACPNDPLKVAPGICGCGVSDVDTDTDGMADCIDPCPNDPTNTCNNCNDPCYAEFGQPTPCATFVDSDSDGTCDATDGCDNDPLKTSPGTCGCGNLEPGSACNDGDNNTINDLIGANCLCAGTPSGCSNNLALEFQNDGNPLEVTWEILDANDVVVQSGINPIPANNTGNLPICLPDGCFRLRVLDSGGDGMTTGGYELRLQNTGERLIDNTHNFNGVFNGAVSTISGGQTFCLPIGTDKPIFSSCDKLDWLPNRFVVCHANPAVSAQYGVTNSTSGYEFWFFDPNGSFSYRRFRSHSTSDGYGSGATRACHFKVNGWVNSMATPHLPSNTLLNLRVRGRVAGNNLEFGAACQFKIDAALAACPRVKLQDDPAHGDQYSCGVSRDFGGGSRPANRIHATPPQPIPAVPSYLVRYQFRFRIPGEGICIVRPPQTSARLVLNWTTGTPLECNKTYEVDVRVSLNGGATWCTGPASTTQAAACADTQDWGKVCQVSINACNELDGGGNSMALQPESVFTLYPNPNQGDQLFVSLSQVPEAVNTLAVDIYDLSGKRVVARTMAVQDGLVNTSMDLNGELAGGIYLVNLTAGERTYSQRLVIQP